MWCLPYRVGRLTLKAKRFHTNDHASHQYQDDVKPLLTLVMDRRTGRNYNFEEESGFGGAMNEGISMCRNFSVIFSN